MEKFTQVTGRALPLNRADVDTDQIIPAKYLKRRYVAHIPAKYDPKKKTPVVLVYHGGGFADAYLGAGAESMVHTREGWQSFGEMDFRLRRRHGTSTAEDRDQPRSVVPGQ